MGRTDASQRSTAQYSTAQHSTAQHSTAQHSTAQHMLPKCSARVNVQSRLVYSESGSVHTSKASLTGWETDDSMTNRKGADQKRNRTDYAVLEQ